MNKTLRKILAENNVRVEQAESVRSYLQEHPAIGRVLCDAIAAAKRAAPHPTFTLSYQYDDDLHCDFLTLEVCTTIADDQLETLIDAIDNAVLPKLKKTDGWLNVVIVPAEER